MSQTTNEVATHEVMLTDVAAAKVASLPSLNGATIDFADTIEKQGFTIDNPNAVGSCACGESFH